MTRCLILLLFLSLVGCTPVAPKASLADVRERTSYDLEFLDRMLFLREDAVEQAQEAVTRGESPEVKELAARIVSEKLGEIERLQDLRARWYPRVEKRFDPSGPPLASVPHLYSDDQFLNAMITQYEVSLSMLPDIQKQAEHPELRAVAEEMSAREQLGLSEMRLMVETAER